MHPVCLQAKKRWNIRRTSVIAKLQQHQFAWTHAVYDEVKCIDTQLQEKRNQIVWLKMVQHRSPITKMSCLKEGFQQQNKNFNISMAIVPNLRIKLKNGSKMFNV